MKRYKSLYNLKEAIKMKPFTKNDWYTFAGAENFEDGSEPLIGEIEIIQEPIEAAVVFDNNAIEIDAFDGDGNDIIYMRDVKDKVTGIAIINKLKKVMTVSDLKKLGFKNINN